MKSWVQVTKYNLDKMKLRCEPMHFVISLKKAESCSECGSLIKPKREVLGIQSEIGTIRYFCTEVCYFKHS